MSSSASSTQLPLNISIAPFPAGFQGDMDETFQQACILMQAYIEGNFLTGLILPPGSTLPSTDQGPVAMGGIWYFWDPVTGAYVPQTVSTKVPANYCKNGGYQVRQLGDSFSLSAIGPTRTYDMVLSRMTQANVLSITADVGPTASGDTDNCPSAIKYTVGTTLITSPAATDIMAHEHLVEGSDINGIQGEAISLGFSVWTNQPGTYSAYLTSNGRDASYVFSFTVSTASQWTRIKINNIPPMPASGTGLIGTWNFSEGQTGMYLGVVMTVGAQFQTTTPNQWISGFFAGTSTNANLCAVTNNQLKITAIKLEANPSCTYFTTNSFERDYHDCIRYYWTSFNYQSGTGGVWIRGDALGTNQANFAALFTRRMCAPPTVVPYSYYHYTAGAISDFSLSGDIGLPHLNAVAKGVAHNVPFTGSTTGNTHTSTTIDGIPSTTGLIVGMTISGSGIPAGATIATIPSPTSITISAATTSTLTGTTLTFAVAQTTGNTHTNTTIDGIPSTTGLTAGMAISGSGIPAGATIATIPGGTSITISAATTSSLTGTPLTFGPIKGDELAAYITADARLS